MVWESQAWFGSLKPGDFVLPQRRDLEQIFHPDGYNVDRDSEYRMEARRIEKMNIQQTLWRKTMPAPCTCGRQFLAYGFCRAYAYYCVVWQLELIDLNQDMFPNQTHTQMLTKRYQKLVGGALSEHRLTVQLKWKWNGINPTDMLAQDMVQIPSTISVNNLAARESQCLRV